MADRPILFSAPMVRALLDGRKTQTRRIIKPQPAVLPEAPGVNGRDHRWTVYGIPTTLRAPGKPGDRLWVREAGALLSYPTGHDPRAARDIWETVGWRHAVDDAIIGCGDHDPTEYVNDCTQRRRPSIHMPRWASRLTLTVTNVRVQRLHEITRDDAMAEGIVQTWGDFMGEPPEWAIASISRHGDASGPHIYDNRTSVGNYRELWDSINGPGAWDANPYVVALSFTVARKNIDG